MDRGRGGLRARGPSGGDRAGRLALLVLLIGSVAGCGTARVVRNPLSGLRPTAAPLEARGWDASLEGPASAFDRLEGWVAAGYGTPDDLLRLSALAERLGRDAEPEGIGHHRDAAVYAWFAAEAASIEGQWSPDRWYAAVGLYNRAVERCLRLAQPALPETDRAWAGRLESAGIAPRVADPSWSALRFDALRIASDYAVMGDVPQSHHEGWGIPLIAEREQRGPRAGVDRYYPGRLRMAATASIRPEGPLGGLDWRSRPVSLVLHDPVDETRLVTDRGIALPMAADLTTPVTYLFLRSPLTKLERVGLFDPDKLDGSAGIYMIRPYEPGKIPVLFVHGLNSSPRAWMALFNALMGDADLRARYQFWFAFYPTGNPAPYSSAYFREGLVAMRETLDPTHSDPAMDRMVLVGHSMGGLVTKALVQDSGPDLWRTIFINSPETLRMTSEQRVAGRRLMDYRPLPMVRRAVFIATPHKGSPIASRVVGRLAASLAHRGKALTGLLDAIEAANGPDVFTPTFRLRRFSSIEMLEWESPLLLALAGRPIAPEVPYHSIIGRLGPASALLTGSPGDGVVSYESAHLEGAASELVVSRSHSMTSAPEVIAEVRRILRLHLAESGLDAAPRLAVIGPFGHDPGPDGPPLPTPDAHAPDALDDRSGVALPPLR